MTPATTQRRVRGYHLSIEPPDHYSQRPPTRRRTDRFRVTTFRSAGLIKIATGIVGMAVAPFLHQCLELGIVAVGQHDAGGDEQVAGDAARPGNALALEAE